MCKIGRIDIDLNEYTCTSCKHYNGNPLCENFKPDFDWDCDALLCMAHKKKEADMKDEQISKDFRMSEFACNDEARTPVPEKYKENVRKLVTTILQPLRDYVGEPLHINSGYRTPAYNRACGGVKRSQHLRAGAGDVSTRNYSPEEIWRIVEWLIKEGIIPQCAIGRYPGFTHLDTRPDGRRWGKN